MTPWQQRAQQIIHDYSYLEWIKNNKQPGYSVPYIVKQIIECLNTNNEHLFLILENGILWYLTSGIL